VLPRKLLFAIAVLSLVLVGGNIFDASLGALSALLPN